MALADPIFTLDGGFQLFWAAFDLPMTVVPLKVALGLEKFYFWAFQKNSSLVYMKKKYWRFSPILGGGWGGQVQCEMLNFK